MSKNNCVIAAVGRDSLHRAWIDGACDFDLHLIVYDDSFEKYQSDTEFVCSLKGFKLNLVHQYLSARPELMGRYEYYFLPDDDILMSPGNINALFAAMRRYNLQIAQPSLVMSYRTWEHTIWDRFTRLRYTNFIEMMVPCFSRAALSRVFFTFAENSTGWGTESHWAQLIGTNHRDMAIVDEVTVRHTRPIQSGQALHCGELAAYLKKYGLKVRVVDYGCVPLRETSADVCDRTTWHRLRRMMEKWTFGDRFSSPGLGSDGWLGYVTFLLSLSRISQVQNFHDMAVESLERVLPLLNTSAGEMPLGELADCCWLLARIRKHVVPSASFTLFYARMGKRLLGDLKAKSGSMSLVDVVKACRCVDMEEERDLCSLTPLLVSKMAKLPLEGGVGVGLLLDMALALKRHGMPYACPMAKAAKEMFRRRSVSVGNAYDMYKLWLLTGDGHYKMRLREELRNMPDQFMTLRNAIMLSEILVMVN